MFVRDGKFILSEYIYIYIILSYFKFVEPFGSVKSHINSFQFQFISIHFNSYISTC